MRWYPRRESNLRTWFRKPLLYPLSYGGTSASRCLVADRRSSTLNRDSMREPRWAASKRRTATNEPATCGQSTSRGRAITSRAPTHVCGTLP